MKFRIAVAVVLVCWVARTACAHRLDEYLQATMVSVNRDHLRINLQLTPGVEVFGDVMEEIDRNADGVISPAEEQAYAEQVGRDLSVSLEGNRLPLRLVDLKFPTIDEMKKGIGAIKLNFDVPASSIALQGAAHRLIVENHHLPEISVYLANCLVPSDPSIHITSQDRNYLQSIYTLDYRQDAAGLGSALGGSTATDSATSNRLENQIEKQIESQTNWLDKSGSKSLFVAFFYAGVRHILTGYDHLLFVCALVLAATTLWDLIKVVSAFTIAHTITLSLASMNLISLPGYVVEPLIAGSIVFIALQNVFWPRQTHGWWRVGAAFFFGLFHGLGFAGGLLDTMREMQSGAMFLAIFAFSIGVETGHQLVVLPLFGLLKLVRRAQPNAVARTQVSLALLRIGSAGIAIAGIYYLCLAITGNS